MSEFNTVLAFGSDEPADILENAAAVTRFLAEVCPAMSGDNGPGLTDASAHGLCLILLTVENSISVAVAGMK